MNWKNQLRKGNIIQTEYGISEICAIAFGDFYVKGDGDRVLHAKTVEPVKLNRKIIENFGFKKIETTIYRFGSIELCKPGSIAYISISFKWIDNSQIRQRIPIKYAHELQNFYSMVFPLSKLEYKPVS